MNPLFFCLGWFGMATAIISIFQQFISLHKCTVKNMSSQTYSQHNAIGLELPIVQHVRILRIIYHSTIKTG